MPANHPFTMREMPGSPGLADNERAFLIEETGSKVAVRVRRVESREAGFICIESCCRGINDTGQTRTIEGVEVRCPPKVKTVQVDLLTEGLTTIEDEIAEMTTEAVRRMNNHVAALMAWRKIPTE